MSAAPALTPTYTRYRLVDGTMRPQAIELTIPARDKESIATFLTRVCGLYEWYVGDEITFVMRGRHITQARVVRQPDATQEATIHPSEALRLATAEVAEYTRGSTTFVINADHVLIHQRSEIFVDRNGESAERLFERLGLRPDDEVSVGACSAQILRYSLRSGELISRVVG